MLPVTNTATESVKRSLCHKLRLTDSDAFRSGTLEQKKKILIQDLNGMVREVQVEWFLENVLPDFDFGAVVRELRKSGMITASEWKAFPNNPKDDPRHETKVYSQLNSVFDAVIETTNSLYPGQTQQFSLVMLPDRPASSEGTLRTEPDATFLSTNIARDLNADEKKVPYSWYDIANPAEFKKDLESCIKIRNMASLLTFIMTVDPLRRFSFGWTMQNRDLRLWFACRGVIFVTEAVDVFRDPGTLVHFFVSIAFSSRTALARDPTIEVSSSSSPRQYTITVNGQRFTTVKNLADYSADSLISRATRVWLVKDEEGKESVLKDVWMDTDQLPEHEILRVSKRMKIDDMDDTTPRMMNEQTPITFSVFDLAIEMSAPSSSRSSHPGESTSQANRSETSKLTPGQMQMEGPQKLTLRSKYHYRIVFEEHGTDLYALDIIHTSGWVHRDISCGKVYWLHDLVKGPRGIIGDFEYAKRCDDQTEHEKRTVETDPFFHAGDDAEYTSQGTPGFMAYEAALQRPPQDFGMRNRNASALFKTGPESVTRPQGPYTNFDPKECMIHNEFRLLLTDETTLEAIKGIDLTPVVRESVAPNSAAAEKRKQPPCDENDVLQKRKPKRLNLFDEQPQNT
ncbi:hypothetical protein D9757_009220 [Collybiopsis confluens]|uniref:Fungal-type protein kinase domain-containing protein n=1 Tax=Collybiopsis confluens TaxID=2823264 RepID=A0A8H5HAB1_9AGAR|nr:hypothetical protein D9757_009220 [Collybiopsis confluens]